MRMEELPIYSGYPYLISYYKEKTIKKSIEYITKYMDINKFEKNYKD
jgi:hypothetical protein